VLKITLRKAGALVASAALAQGLINCAAANGIDTGLDEPSAYEEPISAATDAYSVGDPGIGTLKLDYHFNGAATEKQFMVSESSTDEFVRSGEALTLEIPGWVIVGLVQTDYDSINNDNLPNVTGKVIVGFYKNGAPVGSTEVAFVSWKDGDYGWKSALTSSFAVPQGVTSLGFTIEATSPDTGRTGVEQEAQTPVFGGELPNKHLFFDLDGAAPRERMLERGGPVAGAELVVAYSTARADQVGEAFQVDRYVGKVKSNCERFGVQIQNVYGDVVHEITAGYSFDGTTWSETSLVTSPKSYVEWGTSQEARLHIPASATRLLTYFRVRTYLVARFPTGGEIVEQKYADGQRVLVGEHWDNPEGTGSNFELGTDGSEPDSSDLKRTVVFIQGETAPGQDMFLRGGIDHDAARSLLGLECQNGDGTPNYLCAIPIRHRGFLNATTSPWKLGEAWLDWYGVEASQTGLSHGIGASGSAADWTTNAWPADFGPEKTVANDGYGLEPLNTFGMHYWMLDVDMDCSKAVEAPDGDGTPTRWFEVKSFITNGPGWEPDVAQVGAPYGSRNHFAKCGMVSVFRRGDSSAQFLPLP
jgi:hypothetical protein